MSVAPQPRRWVPRYSLRTLFVLMTAVCCWLGYELNWIRSRHEALTTWESGSFADNPFLVGLPQDDPEPPGMLWLFGEQGYATIWREFPARSSDQLTEGETTEVKKVKGQFPEAEVSWSFREATETGG